MISARRNELKDYVSKECVFIAMVHYIDYRNDDLVLDDVSVETGVGEYKRLALHLHVYGINIKELKRLKPEDIIIFTATAYDYNMKNKEIKYKNFSLHDVKNIIKVGGRYNG